jgi:hypothetical protein
MPSRALASPQRIGLPLTLYLGLLYISHSISVLALVGKLHVVLRLSGFWHGEMAISCGLLLCVGGPSTDSEERSL